MEAVEKLLPRLRAMAFIVLRHQNVPEDELVIEVNEPGKAAYCLIKGHRVNIMLDDGSVAFKVRTGRWSGARADYPTAGAFIADFESALNDALAG